MSAWRSISSCRIAPVDLVQRLRLGVDLRAQAGGGFVDQVDGLVGQVAIGDVALRQRGGGDDGAVLDAHAVVDLVALLQTAQDADRVLDARLVDQHRLEAAFEGGVLLDVLAVLVERRGADHVQLAARQHRLEHVAGVHRAFGRAGADDGVHLVDEQDDLAGGVGHFLEHRLETLLELAAVLGPGHQGAQIELDDALVLQAFRHVAVDDALRQPLDDGRLADARFPDQAPGCSWCGATAPGRRGGSPRRAR